MITKIQRTILANTDSSEIDPDDSDDSNAVSIICPVWPGGCHHPELCPEKCFDDDLVRERCYIDSEE